MRMTGLIDKYNGDVNLPQWTGKCANVHGASDGVKFPSYIMPNDTLLFFRKSLCRSERLVISIIAIIATKWLNSSTKNLLSSHATRNIISSIINFLPLYRMLVNYSYAIDGSITSSNSAIFSWENFVSLFVSFFLHLNLKCLKS